MTKWGLTVDCAHPGALAVFWALALGYRESPPPEGFASVGEWLESMGVPEEEWDDGAYLSDPAGVGRGADGQRPCRRQARHARV